mmetsp:Transcript_31150/g.56522  ORF Transcript_31150/g.56522 Transcript_31150/m.56522 type:complete len:455 (-) Transcript_31150:380-1744(-)|eukprot:CAMPEP_0201942246 /NCGR_PEP_ID=MMETSP0903-20130614/48683_1 /ASSEMBLY_ACC=CAM_ASM_000552 /TAXON_ID=420261 /ORGANISM="Thalassiosira antarctica, Strain CCMP982" /LENGTH=454 /DNA_ID=CAMNT_0048484575 /DNA_START=53 /DNA_END=1417 /DNA_ORIENTATION=+
MTLSVISSARSWLPFLLRPQNSLKSLIECWSSYDPPAWESQLELVNSGIKLGLDILIPTLLLCLVGSFLPSPSLGASIDADGLPSFLVQKSMVDVFSPSTSALASLPPTSTSSATIRYSLSSNFDLTYLLRLITLSIISPITMDVIFNHFAPILIQVFSRLKFVLMSRNGPDASTKAALLQRVRMGRAIRRHAYDLYLPPKSSDAAKLDHITSLLFFPGFGIHHSAYADVAGSISDYGVPVTVVSLEPFRLAHKALGGGMDDVRRLIKSAGKEVAKYYKHMHGENVDNEKNSIGNEERDGNIIVEWALGGHSMGGYNALQLAEELIKTDPPSVLLHDGSISRVGSQIVAWAAGTVVEGVPNLLEAGSPSQLRIFILLASNDEFAKFSSQQQKHQLLSKLPKTSRLETIQGANHSGFSSYDAASKKGSAFDGPRDITLEAQHKEASSRTARFLLS